MQTQRRSVEASSDASYCERDNWEDWGSRSSLSQAEEVATQSSGHEDISTLRAERDALARALSAERARSASAARAHDARLAELHGVIAELVRRRTQDKAAAIPEEDGSDECESTTQPAGELDNDGDLSRTEQNDTSSALSPSELPTPQESKLEPIDQPDDTDSAHEHRLEQPRLEVTAPEVEPDCDTSLNLSERDSEICLTTARCCQAARGGAAGSAGGSCEREHGSPDAHLYTHSTGRCEPRQAKLASRVRLRKTEDTDSNPQLANEQSWCAQAAERLALDVCAQADVREALVAAHQHDGASWCTSKMARLEAELAVLRCALHSATDTAHRLYCSCAVQESCCVSLCLALRAADRALETYDVLLALAETVHSDTHERSSAELVASQLLARLEAEQGSASIGEPLLSPGPWLQHRNQAGTEQWSVEQERALRRHAARLKADTVRLRGTQPAPQLFSYHDISEEELVKCGRFSMCDMEAAVALQEALAAAETKAKDTDKSGSGRRHRSRHWLDAAPSETDL